MRLQAERRAAFEARVRCAKAAREEAERELRLLFYLDSLTVQEVRGARIRP